MRSGTAGPSLKEEFPMCPEPVQKLQSEPTSQERGATGNSLEKTNATPALPPERPKRRPNILPETPTPNLRTATLEARLVKSGVPRDPDFVHGLLGQLLTAGDMASPRDDHEIGFLFSVIEGYGPRDMLDAMLCSQSGMLQGAIVRQQRLLNRTHDPVLRDVAVNTLAKLVRTFTAVSDALTRRRRGDSPSVSVGHVSFGEGAQAILGNVTQSQGEAAPDEAAPSPPLLVDAKAVPMPSVENKEQVPVPVSRARTEEQRTFEKRLGITRAILGRCFRARGAVPELDPASPADRRPSLAKGAAVCMAEHRGRALQTATNTRSSTECIRAKPLRNAGQCGTCCVNRAAC
jgi:hypothetical protein